MIGISIANTMTWMISWYVHLFLFVLTISSRIIHCNYNDKDDIMIIIPLHLCTDTPCHLPTWTAPPCNWPKDQKIKFSLQLSQKGFCSYFKRFYFYFSSPILVPLRIPTVVKVTFWQICISWSKTHFLQKYMTNVENFVLCFTCKIPHTKTFRSWSIVFFHTCAVFGRFCFSRGRLEGQLRQSLAKYPPLWSL